MPYPSQISAEAIVHTAARQIEQHGVEKLSLNIIADSLGVKAPSLYRYFNNKTALLRAVNVDTVERLFNAIQPGLESTAAPAEAIWTVAKLYRDFALQNSSTYGLLFTNTIDDLRPDEQENEQRVQPFQQLVAKVSGDTDSLAATRGLLAILHGFVMLEIADQLRRGGDLSIAFEQSVRAYITGWQEQANNR